MHKPQTSNSKAPIRALWAFEATARLGSFKVAAEELNVTPGAVSQQIKKLEEWLGYALFERKTRKLVITEAAQALYQELSDSLSNLDQTCQRYRAGASTDVSVSMSTSMAAKWLAPRLADFMILHPEINVRINATNDVVDFRKDKVDMAIRYFDGQAKDLNCQLLCEDEVMVVCSPSYQAKAQLGQIEQLNQTTLIEISLYPDWNFWLSKAGASVHCRGPKLYFDQSLLAIEAAKRGQGVTLSNKVLSAEELSNGTLIEPLPIRIPSGKGYYLVSPQNRRLSPSAKLFSDWLITSFSRI